MGGAGGGRSASPRNAFHVARRCLCAFASVVVVYSFCCIAIVAFFQVLFARHALSMKKGRRTDRWEDEWDNENIIVANS